LIIDDDEAIRKFLIRAMRLEGYEPIPCTGGQGAIGLACETRPDAIILDLRLPGPDGLTLLETMRESDVTCPVIVISGDDEIKTRERVAASSASSYLIKPVGIAQLLACLERAMTVPELTVPS
jgi:DNA-binding response OmpR family regulator